MTKNILLIGVGGQGTILTSKILAAGLSQLGYDVKMSEIHGMSQRGGSVTTQIRFGDRIYAPNIGLGEADIVVSFEKLEALRALPYLKKGGIVITDEKEIHPSAVLTGQAEYPANALDAMKAAGIDVRVVPAAEKAQELGSAKAQNILLLGALVAALRLDGVAWEALVAEYVPARLRDMNVKAFITGKGLL